MSDSAVWVNMQILLYAFHLNLAFVQNEIVLCVFTICMIVHMVIVPRRRGKLHLLICQFTCLNILYCNSCENWISHWGPLFSLSVWWFCNRDEGCWSWCLSSEKLILNHCALIDFYCLIGDRQVCSILVGFHSEVKPKNVLWVIRSKYILVLHDI